MITIRATTTDCQEFFRVVDLCYDRSGIGHLIVASCGGTTNKLRLTLPFNDLRLAWFEELVRASGIWHIESEG